MSERNILDCAAPRNDDAALDSKKRLLSRCRLKEAKKVFAHRGWEALPQNERGQSILRWGADHAWLAASGSPQTSVRRWARCWAPWLTVAELNELIAYTEHSNKRWSADQCAAVLEISVTDRISLKLRHIGAADDPYYELRSELQRAKSVERSRRYRAKRSTGAKRGRPKSEGLKPWQIAGASSKATYYRNLKKDETGETGNASRHLSNIIDGVMEFRSHASKGVIVLPSDRIEVRRAPQAPRRNLPVPVEVLEGEIVTDVDGLEGTMHPALASAVAYARHLIKMERQQ